MMLALEPDIVDASKLDELASPAYWPDSKIKGGSSKVGKSSYRWRPFSHITHNGVLGNPTRSSAVRGQKMLGAGAKALAKLIMDPETWAAPNDLKSAETGGVPFRT